jgi:hypothetical protein
MVPPPGGEITQTRAYASSLLKFLVHTHTYTHPEGSSERVISSSQRLLPTNTRQIQKRNIHAISKIRTRDPSNRAAADLRRIPHGCSQFS